MNRVLGAAVLACAAPLFGARAGQVPACVSQAYLWLDAAATNTLTVVEDEVTFWASANAGGVTASAYTLPSNSPSGPTLVPCALPAGDRQLVSFGSTTANKDLSFAKATTIRTVFFVGRMEQSTDAFLLGDDEAYHFHRGGAGEYWHESHAAAGIRNGKTYWNGAFVSAPTTSVQPPDFGLLEVVSTENLTASRLCYDRSGSDSRRGGKDIAELLVFTNALTTADQIAVRGYLMEKWGLGPALTYDTAEGVHRNDADLSAGVGLGNVFTQGAGAYGFKNIKLTGNVQKSESYTLVVEEGDRIEIAGDDTLNGRNRFAYDIRGGEVVWPATASTWYENASFKQSGGTFTARTTATDQNGTGAGLLLGYNGSPALTFDITGGTFAVPNSSLNFYNPCTFTVSNATLKAKGVFKSNKAGVITIGHGGVFELGSLGWKAGSATLTLDGGTFKAYETTTLANDATVSSASSLVVPRGVILTIAGRLTGTGPLAISGGGEVRFVSHDPTLTAGVTVEGDGTVVRYTDWVPDRIGSCTLVWSDEFNGTDVDWTKWSKVPVLGKTAPNWRKNTSHRDDLVTVTNGMLVLTGVKNDGTRPAEDGAYQCGQIWGSGKLSFTQGIIEIRAKFDDQNGAWPALWMMPDLGNWPLGGEIDIVERLDKQNYVFQTVHHGPVQNGTSTSNGSHDNTIVNGEWNVYRLEWTDEAINWYVNGVKTYSYANDGSGNDAWPFTTPFHFILSQQLENHWLKTAVEDATLPVNMYVDYVRVYQDAANPKTLRRITIEGDVEAGALGVTVDEHTAYRIDTAATLHLDGTGYQTFDAPLTGAGTLTLDAPGASVLVTAAADFTGTIIGTEGTEVHLPENLSGNNASLAFTAFQTQSSYYRGKNEFQPLIGLKAEKLGFTTLWRLGVQLPEDVDPSIIADVKLYKSTVPYFAASQATELWDGLVKSRNGRAISLSFQASGNYPTVNAGEYLWVGVRIDANAPANAKVDGKISEVVVNGYFARVDDCDPIGYGTVYPWAFHIVPYWRLNKGTLSALTRQHLACYTDIIPFYISVGKDGSILHGWNGEQFTDAKFQAAIDRMKALRGDLDIRLLVGVGFSQNNLPDCTASATARRNAARNLAAFVNRFGLDGVDFDWEYPTTGAHWAGWCNLVSELKRELFRLPGGGKQVSIAVTGYRTAQGGGSLNPSAVAGLYQQCDFVSMMSYDGDEWAGHATLGLMQNDFTRAAKYGGIPAYKICGGQAFYTNHYPRDGSQNGYSWVVNNYPQYIDSTDRFTADDGKVYTYNSIATIKAKCADCVSRGGGAMIWANETDVAITHPKSATRALFSQITPTRAKAGEGDLTLGSADDWAFLCSMNGRVTLTNDLVLTNQLRPHLKGVLNGNGHTVFVSGAPLLTKLTGVVSNLTIVVTSDLAGNGSLADTVAGNGLIQDVHVIVQAGATITGGTSAGGLVGDLWAGSAEATASVRNCTAEIAGTITATGYGRVGGLVGNANTSGSPAASEIADNTVWLRATAQLVAPAGTQYSGVGGAVGNLNVPEYPVRNTTIYKDARALIADNSGGNRAGDVVGGNCWGSTPSQVTGSSVEAWVDPDYVDPDWTRFTTSTSSSPVWTSPRDGMWSRAGACTIATEPIGFSVGSGASTLTLNIIATLPAGKSGAVAGWKVGDNTVQLVYDAAANRFDVTYNGTMSYTNTVQFAPAEVTKPHVYTIAITAANSGVFVYQDGIAVVNAPNVYWGGSQLNTAYTLGAAVDGTSAMDGLVVQAADYNFSAAVNDQDRVFARYSGLPEGLPTAFKLKVISEAMDADGDIVIPAVAVNGKPLVESEAVTTYWAFDGDLTAETNFTFALEAPVVGEGLVGLTLAGDDPVNAVLTLEAAGTPAGPWQTAAEIAAGSASRAFVVRTADDRGFYKLRTAASVTPAAVQGMPVSLTSPSRVNMGTLSITEADLAQKTLVVQFAGAAVAEGLRVALEINGTAYAAEVDASGAAAFDLSNTAALTPPLQGVLSLYTTAGMTNGDLFVSSPAVGGLTYPTAVLTAMVADTPLADGFVSPGFGCEYRIPALASDGAGEVLCCYDVRYGATDLGYYYGTGTAGGIDIGETYSADGGRSFSAPKIGVDVPNFRRPDGVYPFGSGKEAIAATNDLGDVSLLYDPGARKYWMMGITGGGLSTVRYNPDTVDVVLYSRGKGPDAVWEGRRSIKYDILDQPGITNTVGLGSGFLEGPGHGMVTTIGKAGVMPVGTLVFPVQYFLNGSSVGAIYSTDQGASWTATQRSTAGVNPQENCVMELDDGSWYMTAKAGSRPGTGRFQFFRTKDYVNWTFVGERVPVPCQQGSCLRLGRNQQGVGQYVYCHTLHPDTATRSQVALVFGSDTTRSEAAEAAPSTENAGIAWDDASTIMLHEGNTGFKGYNSLAMLDDHTLGVLYEAQGHIYFIRVDVSDRLR